MRVTTAFNRLLRLPGAAVIDLSFRVEGVIGPCGADAAGGCAAAADRQAGRSRSTIGATSAGGTWTSAPTVA